MGLQACATAPELCYQHSWWDLPVLSGAQMSGHSDAEQTLCCFLLLGANPPAGMGQQGNPSRVCPLREVQHPKDFFQGG